MRSLPMFVVFFVGICCATTSEPAAQANGNAILTPPSSPALELQANPIIVPPDPPEEASAGELLERGFTLFHMGMFALSSQSFTLAIGTGNLNDAGRALAYWHIAECQSRLDNKDNAADAFQSFLIVGQDILDIRENRRFAVTNDMDFVDHFQLKEKLGIARAYVSALWAARSDAYGRSLNNPVLARTIDEIATFVALFVEGEGCEGQCAFIRDVLTRDNVPVIPHTERITITHPDGTSDVIFAVMIEEKEEEGTE